MLDAHPDVRWFGYIFFIIFNLNFSGEETRVIPRVLALRAQWKKSEKEWRRLQVFFINFKFLVLLLLILFFM